MIVDDPTAANPLRRLLPSPPPIPRHHSQTSGMCTHQAVGSGVGGNRDARGRGATRPGGQPLPELFSQEGHQWGKEAETDVSAGEQDLRGGSGTGRVQ